MATTLYPTGPLTETTPGGDLPEGSRVEVTAWASSKGPSVMRFTARFIGIHTHNGTWLALFERDDPPESTTAIDLYWLKRVEILES